MEYLHQIAYHASIIEKKFEEICISLPKNYYSMSQYHHKKPVSALMYCLICFAFILKYSKSTLTRKCIFIQTLFF